ncbi:FAD-binding protein [Calderihabitans maritimus]|uniref:L-aspartate oxidase n=1 Tax=Calderihabitans maritimus TaxID=1246530 RepID=A0A1Z5HUJ9_9FIRM|nr:FAD-binding protein [Calderihabitans maritimus]GAW93213.1 L-aspartate oxidase [Calderihabitans maritimus]
MEELVTDILILGSGGAGLFAALQSADADPRISVTLVTKGLVGKSGCTRMVQGGYNVVLNPRDSLELHFKDTLKGGQFINDQELAWLLVSNAPRTVRELETKVGCFFDRDEHGNIHQKPFAGQSFDRTVHRGDLTGIEIISRLREQVFRRQNIKVIEECRAIDLVTNSEGTRIAGAVLLDIRTGQFLLVRAKAILVATGGGARMYKISAPSMEKSGDGVAMAYRVGAVLMDMEMLQFHPTGLLAGNSRLRGSVLEEGLRGAGAYLFNAKGERFMERYDPERKERSTRDVVARSSYMEILGGRGTPDGGVYLDMSHLGAEFVETNFPGMVERVREIGKDLAREPIEVSPTAHFHMGGIRINLNCQSNIEGLFAAGEDAAGVHGANRLGGNGVAESTVFGILSAERMVDYIKDVSSPSSYSQKQVEEIIERAIKPFKLEVNNSESPFALREEIEEMMWQKVGVVRNGNHLKEALEELNVFEERLEKIAISGPKEYNVAWNEVLNLRNILIIAKATALSALLRTESRGSHYREDFPHTDKEWFKNICLQKNGENEFKVFEQPVNFTRMKPEDVLN